MNTLNVLLLIQLVAKVTGCGKEIFDLIEQVKSGQEITQAQIDQAAQNAEQSRQDWLKAVEAKE